ncbi:cytochrome c peroxidase [Zobellella maritima]|uniref:cytochrome c peroxidase n=1 Tax=Zobellella maritima TaxID=2059725 RepID=UPI0018E554CC|nr:cytochrome c peroxidase [Zobellella maritima]
MSTTIFRTSAITRVVTIMVFASGLNLTSGQVQAKKDKDTANLDDGERIEALTELGKRVFFDPISDPKGAQSCSSCHDPATGWTGPSSDINRLEVAQPGANIHKDPEARGGLRPPTNAYATLIPSFKFVDSPFGNNQVPVGGAFWDGRSEGDEPLFPNGATEHIYLADVLAGVTEGTTPLSEFERAVKHYLGPVADQALNPFPNPVEQNIREKAVCHHVEKSSYANLFRDAWGERIKCNEDVYRTSFKRIAVALAAYQDSPEVNAFSSKRDDALRKELACMPLGEIQALSWAQRLPAGESVESVLSRFGVDEIPCDTDKTDSTPGRFPLAGLDEMENWGHDLFYAFGSVPVGAYDACMGEFITEDSTPKPGARCVACHTNNRGDDGTEPLQIYSDHGYRNIGTPVNFEIPGVTEAALGLAGHTVDENGVINEAHVGLVKTPGLRNVDKRPDDEFVKAYTSNGWFKSLESLVHFYNTSLVTPDDSIIGAVPNHDVVRCPDYILTEAQALGDDGLPACWPEPGHTNAVSFRVGVTGNLGLSACDEEAIVAYLKTFSDGFGDTKGGRPPKNKKSK